MNGENSESHVVEKTGSQQHDTNFGNRADATRRAATDPDGSVDSVQLSFNRGDEQAVSSVVVLIEDPIIEGSTAAASSNKVGVNPQEASAPVSPSETSIAAPSEQQQQTVEQETSKEDLNCVKTTGTKKKNPKRRRIRVVPVTEDSGDRPVERLPPNQYETTLRRRAIRKRQESEPTSSHLTSPTSRNPPSTHSSSDVTTSSAVSHEQYDEEYGDISLGMKLNILAGRVIVQAVKPLEDGRASPAQLSGMVQRGDVLLSVDHASLVNLSLDQMVEGLKPLSTALDDGSYRRTLHLRFAMGEGRKILEKHETAVKKAEGAKTDPNMEAANDIFSLTQFMPMVDQLSGVPLFEKHHHDMTKLDEPVEAKLVVNSGSLTPKKRESGSILERMSMDQTISVNVADRLRFDRNKYLSEFFVWNETHPELLRVTMAIQPQNGLGDELVHLTRSQLIRNGRQVMSGAKAMFHNMEDIDKGKDSESYKRWSSTLSWASSRRRYGREGSVRVGSTTDSRTPTESSGVVSSASEEHEGLTGDELLLVLAAQDEIWRKQLLDTLAMTAKAISESEKQPLRPHRDTLEEEERDPVMSLGTMLLGPQVSSMLTKKKSYALPPKDATAVLFDLVSSLSETPDEISLRGNTIMNARAALVPFHRSKHIVADDNSLLASCFVVEEALPAWLESFRPMPWNQRRLLWPGTPSTSLTSGSSHFMSDDGLTTLDSGSTGNVHGSSRPRKTLEEQIEDKELDTEVRGETCSLLTIYFTQVIIPKVSQELEKNSSEMSGSLSGEEKAVAFIERFGAYLKLHVCLAYAAAAVLRSVVQSLLSLAQWDVRHRQAMKELSKAGTLVLYEPTLLSAVAKKLHDIKSEKKHDRQRDIIIFAASAYPDLRPWQVREVCMTPAESSASVKTNKRERDVLEELYYEYLSLLLHPLDGNDSARRDWSLVQEWCELSIRTEKPLEQRRENFRTVASQTSGKHYRRDLDALAKLSMEANERGLALELVKRILLHPRYSNDESVVADVKQILRTIAQEALHIHFMSNAKSIDTETLKVVFSLFESMSASTSRICRKSIRVPDELYNLVLLCGGTENDGNLTKKMLALITLISRDVLPEDALQTLALWTPQYPEPSLGMSFLHTLVQRGAQIGIERELSGSLLRVKYARLQSAEFARKDQEDFSSREQTSDNSGDIWRRMFDGDATVDK